MKNIFSSTEKIWIATCLIYILGVLIQATYFDVPNKIISIYGSLFIIVFFIINVLIYEVLSRKNK